MNTFDLCLCPLMCLIKQSRKTLSYISSIWIEKIEHANVSLSKNNFAFLQKSRLMQVSGFCQKKTNTFIL